ncbi:MAG: OmpA family protein [Pseudomonadota bacterium]
MRLSTLAAAGLLALSLAAPAVAASLDDAAYDKNNSPVIDTRGNCVRTIWQDKNDPCAPPAPKPVAVAAPRPAPVVVAPVPVISTEQRTIYFEFNKAGLTAESTAKLDQLATVINDSTAITNVTIHGYTDQIGTASYNDALATKRSLAVKSYLDSKSRLKADNGDIRGLGKSAPEAACSAIKKRADKISCMAKERRVEVEFNAQK